MRTGFLAEYAAATERAGIVPLAGWTTVRVTGRDRLTLLNNLATNDVKSLAEGDGCEAFFCDAKGKIVAHVVVLAEAERVTLLGAPGLGEKLIRHIDRYVIREDVQVVDESAARRWRLLCGPESASASAEIAELCGAVSERAWAHQTSPGSLSDRSESPTVQIVRSGLAGVAASGGWLVGVAAAHEQEMVDALAGSAVRSGDDVGEALRIEALWPMYGVDFDESHLPQEVNRNQAAISFRKGCYLGQETVARIDALGHVNRKLVGVLLASGEVPARGTELTAGEQVVGAVTSTCWSPRHGAPLCLAMVRRGANEPSSQLECRGEPATVISSDWKNASSQ